MLKKIKYKIASRKLLNEYVDKMCGVIESTKEGVSADYATILLSNLREEHTKKQKELKANYILERINKLCH